MSAGLIERLEAATGGHEELDGLMWLWERPDHQYIAYSPRLNQCWADFGVGHADVQNPQCWVRGTIFRDDTGQVQAFSNPPNVTTSLDAALALAERVLPGWAWQISPQYAEIACAPWPYYENACDNGGQSCDGATPALALCIAILKATPPLSDRKGGEK